MRKFLIIFIVIPFLVSLIKSQYSENLALKYSGKLLSDFSERSPYEKALKDAAYTQLKKRKTVNAYFGAGYSFVIFTNNIMNTGYPILDFNSGDFLSEVNLFFGFSIAKAVTLEFEPSILFTRNNRAKQLDLTTPIHFTNDTGTYRYDFPSTVSMLSFPLAINVRFFPMFKNTGFARLFFIGGGVGAMWVREEYDHFFTTQPSIYNNGYSYNGITVLGASTSQWAPIFRIMTGFTGSGGAFGFGGEIRYNIVPLKSNDEPFRTRIANNANSVDLGLRFYFSL